MPGFARIRPDDCGRDCGARGPRKGRSRGHEVARVTPCVYRAGLLQSPCACPPLVAASSMCFTCAPHLRRRHPADRIHHRTGADPEDPGTPRRTTRTTARLSRAWPADRLGRARAGPLSTGLSSCRQAPCWSGSERRQEPVRDSRRPSAGCELWTAGLQSSSSPLIARIIPNDSRTAPATGRFRRGNHPSLPARCRSLAAPATACTHTGRAVPRPDGSPTGCRGPSSGRP